MRHLLSTVLSVTALAAVCLTVLPARAQINAVRFTGELQLPNNVAGPRSALGDATSPFTIPTDRPARLFRAAEITAPDTRNNQMRITIGARAFVATLYEYDTATAFEAMLPKTIEMSELNGNEKYSRLSEKLPKNASNPRTIQTGHLMLYGSDTIVLFYKTFSTSYSYTIVGRINDPAGLADALGTGTVTVTFQSD